MCSRGGLPESSAPGQAALSSDTKNICESSGQGHLEVMASEDLTTGSVSKIANGVLRQRNSISSGPHGSRLQFIRRASEKWEVTVHFASDSLSVSLAASPVDCLAEVKCSSKTPSFGIPLSRAGWSQDPRCANLTLPPRLVFSPSSCRPEMPKLDYGSQEPSSHFLGLTFPSSLHFRRTGFPSPSGTL
ncbi:unnamed protein product [Rangifer tarandus platyrhynchus]|uniref:Uncharacterized protein n=1 Tax=Rangifer tarandus platyrhynchus TaxID=3082113 RepID=A0ABN8YNX2_RANTA|nr:unnamed protein product [Rangifer tarandus platyrhynchus]